MGFPKLRKNYQIVINNTCDQNNQRDPIKIQQGSHYGNEYDFKEINISFKLATFDADQNAIEILGIKCHLILSTIRQLKFWK